VPKRRPLPRLAGVRSWSCWPVAASKTYAAPVSARKPVERLGVRGVEPHQLLTGRGVEEVRRSLLRTGEVGLGGAGDDAVVADRDGVEAAGVRGGQQEVLGRLGRSRHWCGGGDQGRGQEGAVRVVGHGTSAMGGTVRGTVPGAPGEGTPRLSVRWGLPRGVWFSAHRGQVLHRDGENVVAFDAWPGQAPLAPRGRARFEAARAQEALARSGRRLGGAARAVGADGPARRLTSFALSPPAGDPEGCGPSVLEPEGA